MSRLQKLVRKAAKRFTDYNVAVIASTGGNFLDPNDSETYTAGVSERRLEQALVTYAAGATTRMRAFLEQLDSDLVLDFFPEADLSGDSIRFLVNGEEFVQKDTGKDVSQFFTQAGRQTIFRTVLAKATGRREGRIRYVSTRESIDLYHYDMQREEWSWVNENALSGRATVDLAPAGSNLMEITLAGELALIVDADGELDVEQFVESGRPDTASLPRLEFYVGQALVAALTKDSALYTRRVTETAVDPVRRDDFAFKSGGGDWLFSLGESGLRVPVLDA